MHEEIWIVNKLRHPDINAVVFKSSGTEALREAVCAVMVDENYYCQRYQQLYKEKSRTMKPSCRICCLLRVSWMY